MSRVLSFRDLRLVPELSKYNEIELLHPDMDDLVNSFLDKLGFDTDYGILYVPSKHRDMQNNVGVGFRVVGEISINRNFINSPLCSTVERLIAAAHQDLSRAKEMAALMGNTINFKALADEAGYEGEEDFPVELIEPDYEIVLAQIKTLEAIRDHIRGDYRNEAGSIKSPAEYKAGWKGTN